MFVFQPRIPFFLCDTGRGGGGCIFSTSVADPDPRVFGPPGSGSTSQRYGSGSGVDPDPDPALDPDPDPSIIMQK
jgi:hypothetical protein